MCHCLRVDWVQWLIWSRFNHCSGLVLTLILCSYFCTLREWVRWIMWVLYYFMWSHISCPCPLCGSWGWLAPHLTTTPPLGTIARVALFILFLSFPFLSVPFPSLSLLYLPSSLIPILSFIFFIDLSISSVLHSVLALRLNPSPKRNSIMFCKTSMLGMNKTWAIKWTGNERQRLCNCLAIIIHTHTHTHARWFLWFTGTLHRRNSFYTVLYF